MFVEELLGAASRVKILRTLTETAAGFTLSEIERETGLSRGIVHKEIGRLAGHEAVIEIKSKGKLRAYRVNVNHPYYPEVVSVFGKEKLSYRKNVVILAVWNGLESIVSDIENNGRSSNVSLIKLFGSHAKGTAAVTSDVDILIVVNEKSADAENAVLEACERRGRKAGISINPVFMSEKVYAKELERNTPFIDQVNRASIELYRVAANGK